MMSVKTKSFGSSNPILAKEKQHYILLSLLGHVVIINHTYVVFLKLAIYIK